MEFFMYNSNRFTVLKNMETFEAVGIFNYLLFKTYDAIEKCKL